MGLAGVHVSTVCRWQLRHPMLRGVLQQAADQWNERDPPEPRPTVRWHRDCPECKARVVVRKTSAGLPFWRCARWPRCPWSSWRPRAPRNCRRCNAPTYWSHSRTSTACDACGLRTRRH